MGNPPTKKKIIEYTMKFSFLPKKASAPTKYNKESQDYYLFLDCTFYYYI
jgi:hypothetical protein